jgi:response regulator NasT
VVQGAIEVALRRYRENEDLNAKVTQLQTALDRRTIIERAKGILMERHRIDDREAFTLLRDHARAQQRRVIEVAESVTEGHALLPDSSQRG